MLSAVPVLTGPNYQQWAPAMTSYLLSQGQWEVVDELAPSPVAYQAATDDHPEVEGNKDKCEKWKKTSYKAVGNIQLRLDPNIQYKYRTEMDPGKLWDALEKDYGKVGVTSIYLEFKKVLELRIPDNSDPTPALDKIVSHFGRLSEAEVELPEHLQALITMAKIPPYGEYLAQIMCQEGDINKITMESVRRPMILAWQQKNSKRPQNPNQNQAKKISAVKRSPNEPSFQQQQQEGEGSGQGQGQNRKRGNRAGRNRGRGRGGFNNQQAHPTEQRETPAPPPPTQPSPPQFQFRHIASPVLHRTNPLSAQSFQPPPMFQSRPPLIRRIAPEEPSKSVWPSFSATHSLAKSLGVTPTIQTIKILETSELTRSPSDPRPQAKQRRIQEDDEVVDLEWSENEVDIFMEDSAGPSGTTHRFVATQCSFPCITDDNHTATKHQQTNYPPSFTSSVQKGRKVVNSLDVDTRITMIFTSCHEIKNEIPIETEWMLDSGASSHFTFDMNDFVEYEPIEPVDIQTANSHTSMIGKGTVLFIMEEEIVRIYPVFYIPDLNQRILSMGQFLQSGMLTVGTSKVISRLEKDKTVFLNFHPRR